jgi:hypothetical protein
MLSCFWEEEKLPLSRLRTSHAVSSLSGSFQALLDLVVPSPSRPAQFFTDRPTVKTRFSPERNGYFVDSWGKVKEAKKTQKRSSSVFLPGDKVRRLGGGLPSSRVDNSDTNGPRRKRKLSEEIRITGLARLLALDYQ